MPELDRHVLLLYVAEQLEKHLDLEILYSHGYEERCRHYRENGPLLVEIARELGYPVLSGWLQEALRATLDSGVPGELRSRDPRRFSWLCVPESCRGKRSIPALLAVARRIRRLLRHRQRHSMHRGVKGG
jgi:hypothetical protein